MIFQNLLKMDIFKNKKYYRFSENILIEIIIMFSINIYIQNKNDKQQKYDN